MAEASIRTMFPLRYFIETPVPIIEDEVWRKLNWSKYEFGVTNKDGLLLITRGARGNRCELKIPEKGKLVGTDKGAEMGSLIFKPADATKPAFEVKKGNMRFIVRLKEHIYFVEATANKGVMYKLDMTSEIFKFTKVVEFEDEPEAYAIFNDSLLVASYQSFYRINADLTKEVLVKNAFWYGLFPTSVAVMDEYHVYIGIRSGYAMLNLTTNKLTFYKYTPY
jgi:hypothetical protein